MAAKLTVTESPPWCRHLMTVEAQPADEMDPDAGAPYNFVSRCICGHDIPWGPYPQTMRAIDVHLKGAGLIGDDGASAMFAATAPLGHDMAESFHDQGTRRCWECQQCGRMAYRQDGRLWGTATDVLCDDPEED